MTSERVRRSAAKAAVTASKKTGRPVDPRVAELVACPNCDGVKCMGCVCREPGHDCASDCPACSLSPGCRCVCGHTLYMHGGVHGPCHVGDHLELVCTCEHFVAVDVVAEIQGAIVATINSLGMVLVGDGFECLQVSPVSDEEVARILGGVGPLDEYRGQ